MQQTDDILQDNKVRVWNVAKENSLERPRFREWIGQVAAVGERLAAWAALLLLVQRRGFPSPLAVGSLGSRRWACRRNLFSTLEHVWLGEAKQHFFRLELHLEFNERQPAGYNWLRCFPSLPGNINYKELTSQFIDNEISWTKWTNHLAEPPCYTTFPHHQLLQRTNWLVEPPWGWLDSWHCCHSTVFAAASVLASPASSTSQSWGLPDPDVSSFYLRDQHLNMWLPWNRIKK